MKTNLLAILLALLSTTNMYSQDQENLEKYWQYRDRYRQQFTKIGALPGESLPLKSRQYQSDQSNLVDDGNGSLVPAYTVGGNLQNGNAFRIWDNTIEHGYYLMVLATEYELLSRDGQDLTAVKNELYYALNAINRIDLVAEQYLSENAVAPSLNGFFLRDDIPPSFLENFEDENFTYLGSDGSTPLEMEAYAPGSSHPNTYVAANDPSGTGLQQWSDYNDNTNEESKDQLSGLLTIAYEQPTDEQLNFELRDLRGSLLGSYPLRGREGMAQVDISDLTDGTYLYAIMNSKRVLESGQVVKQR